MAKVNQLLAIWRSGAGGLGSNYRPYITRIHGSNCRSYFGSAVGNNCESADYPVTVMKQLTDNWVESYPISHATPIKKKKKQTYDPLDLDFIIASGGPKRIAAEWIISNRIEKKKKWKENAKERKKKIREMNRDIIRPLFDRWAEDNNKVYVNEEEREKRFQIFKERLDYVGKEFMEKGAESSAGLNRFSDMHPHELPSCGRLVRSFGSWVQETHKSQPPGSIWRKVGNV